MKIFSRKTLILLIAPLILLTSCIEITEEYHFNTDGSGDAKFSVDMSQMIEMMKSFSASDTTGEYEKSIDSIFNKSEQTDKLRGIAGISNIQNLSDRNTGIVSYSYHFQNISALNQAIASSNIAEGVGMSEGDKGKNSFSLSGKKLSRTFKNAPTEEQDESTAEMAAMMFKDAHYTTVYTFDKPVKKVKSGNAEVTDGRKSVKISVGMYDLIQGKENISFSLKMK